MTIHISRDFLTSVSSSAPATNMYLLATFMNHVLSFDVDKHVNFDLTSSTYTKGQYDLDANNLQFASINNATGSEYTVTIPQAAYTVSPSDIGRILALRSNAWPRHNSGLFRISSASVINNSLQIDYRSTMFPPEEVSSLAWRVYETEAVATATFLSGSDGTSGYSTRGNANASRIMLNSLAGYHVRLCMESQDDRVIASCSFSIAPGAGSVDGADFDDLEGNLHGAMWYKTKDQIYKGTVVGLPSNASSLGQWRFYAMGDPIAGSVLAITRNVSFATGGNGWTTFGYPEDEEFVSNRKIIDRLFVMGYGNTLSNLSWHSGFFNDGHAQGMTWSKFGYPMPCIMSSYSDIRNIGVNPRNLSSSANTPFGNVTELTTVELIGGTMLNSLAATTSSIFQFAPRRVGRLPIARSGRSNYGQWTTTPDLQWLHTMNGIFVPWGGPSTLDNLTGSANAYEISTTFAEGAGIQFFEPDPPMSDPEVEDLISGRDHDAARYRKTYSYYRQPTIEVGIVKKGSNPAKP